MTTWSAKVGTPTDLMLSAELGGPERRDRQVRAPRGPATDHVVGRDLGLGDGVAPVLQGEELVPEQRVREPGDVAGDEDVVGDDPVHVEGPAPRVAGDPAGPGGQPGLRQPLGVADRRRAPRRATSASILAAVGQVGAGEPAARVPSSAVTVTPQRRSTPWSRCMSAASCRQRPAERAHQGRGAAFGDRDVQSAFPAGGGDLRAGEAGADRPAPVAVRRPAARPAGRRRRGCAG